MNEPFCPEICMNVKEEEEKKLKIQLEKRKPYIPKYPQIENVLIQPEPIGIISQKDYKFKEIKELRENLIDNIWKFDLFHCDKIEPEDIIFGNEKMRKIHIQDKEIRSPFLSYDTGKDNSASFWEILSKGKVLFSKANVIGHPQIQAGFCHYGLVKALLYAYTYHADIILNPSDFLLTVYHRVALMINKAPEKFREQFVDFNDKELLFVNDGVGDLKEAPWEKIFDEICKMLQKNIKGPFALIFCVILAAVDLLKNMLLLLH